jgi:hypothetical protein
MTDIYSNIVGDNQEVSRKWLYMLTLMVASCIPTLYLDITAHLLFIVWGMFVISSVIRAKFNFVSKFASITSLVGAVLAVTFAVIAREDYIENNFFPIYNNLFFVIGLSLFFAGIVLQSLILLIDKVNFSFKNISSVTLALIMLLAILSLFISFYNLKDSLVGNIAFDHKEFYEIIFCSFSHILNFFFIQLFILGVIYVVSVYFLKKKVVNQSDINFFSILNILATFSSFLSFYFYKITSPKFINFYITHLKVCGGVIVGYFILRFIIIIFCTRFLRKNNGTQKAN